jgi:hypothetical protein
MLRSVSLTLRGKELRPATGAFQFEGEAPLEMNEATPPVLPEVRRSSPASVAPPVETPASPADTLHVLAALNELGADVGDPVEVAEDAGHHHVVVHAGGLSPERRTQIAAALKSLPRIALDLDSGSALSSLRARPAGPERYSTSIPGAFREQLEQKTGGAVALQEVSDHVLEASASMLGRVHAVQVLAEKFPAETEARLTGPDRDLLRTLRQRHAAELERLAAQIRTELKPLLTVSARAESRTALSATRRQDEARALVASARELDGLLNRLLAGSYSQAEGEEMLRSLEPALGRFEAAVGEQRQDGR